MLPTFGLTGMDAATETALKSAFAEASMRLGGKWPLVSEQDASHVVVDMDSMYGPMSWLRLHGAGKVVIGLTSAPRAQTDFRLGKPFSAESVAELLQQIAPSDGAPHGVTPAPAPEHQLPEEIAKPVNEEAAAPDQRPSAAVSATLETPAAPPARPVEAPSAAPPAPSATAPVVEAPAAPPRPTPAVPQERTLIDWLAPGQLSGRVRLERAGTSVLLDLDQHQYFGPATLKPLAPHVEAVLKAGDFTPVDAATWNSESTMHGQAQPLARLLWFCALQAGKGKLMPGFDPGAQYRLLKWPQTEREFPKHFRIATTMMKGPATLEEIAAGSGVTREEVVDFVNANLATGYAELVPDTPPESSEPARPAGLFGRLRGR